MPPKTDPIPLIYSTSLFQVFILIMLFISLFYGQQTLVILSMLLLVMFSAARIWCRYSQGGLECRLTPSQDKVFPGETVSLQAEVVNHKFLPLWLEINVVIDLFLRRESDENHKQSQNLEKQASSTLNGNLCSKPGSNLHGSSEQGKPEQGVFRPFEYTKTLLNDESGLLWKQIARFAWELAPVKRGVYQAGPVHLTTGDIFGFYQRESKLSFYRKITVYPRLVTLNPFSPPFHELFGTPGLKSPVVDPIYTVSTREYQENRPARFIHWKASARRDRLQEKVFEPSGQQKILLVLDVQGFAEESEQHFEQMLEVVASLSVIFETRGQAFGLASNGTLIDFEDETEAAVIPPGLGYDQLYHLLETLARLKKEPHQLPLSDLLHQADLSMGVTALYFGYYRNFSDDSTGALFNQFKIPVISILAGSPVSGGPGNFSLDQMVDKEEVIVE